MDEPKTSRTRASSRPSKQKKPETFALAGPSLIDEDVELIIARGIFFILNDKGGVGKSTFAKVLAEYLLKFKVAFTGIETDRRNPNFYRAYKDLTPFVTGIFSEDPNLRHEGDIVASRAEEGLVLVDTPSQCVVFLLQWLIEDDVISYFKEQDIPVTALWLSDGGDDSQRLFYRFLEQTQGLLRYFLVCNHGFLRDWRELELNETFLSYQRTFNFTTLVFPFCPTQEREFVRNNQLSFSAALNPEQGLTGVARQRLHTFLKETFAEINRAGVFSR